MARVPSVAQTEQTFRPLASAVRRLAVAGRCCASCGSLEIRPSNRRNALDILLACLFLAPFRCRVCRGRFYRMWRPSLQRSPDPPIAPLLVMPPRRQALNLDSVEPRRLEPEPVQPQRSQQPEIVPPERKADVIAAAPVESPDAKSEPAPPLSGVTPDRAAPAPAAPGAAAPGAILILENDLSIRKLLRRLLERRGYFIVEIAQADDLAGEMLDRRVDLLIVDVSTVETGVEAVVKLARALPNLRLLALSAEPLPENEIPERLLVLPKPFPLDSFVDGVDRLLQGPTALDTSS
jgi:CheY-like chemotaxis protein